MQSLWNFPRKTTSVRLLLDICQEEHNIAPSTLLRGSHITPAQLNDPDSLIETAQEIRVIRNILAIIDQPLSLALKAGMRIHLPHYGLYGMAIMASSTVRHALETGVRFIELSWMFSRPRLEESDNKILIISDVDAFPEELRPFLLLRDLGAVMAVQKASFPTQRAKWHVSTTLAFSPEFAELEKMLESEVRYEQERHCISIPKSYAATVSPYGDPIAYERWCAECEKFLIERQSLTGVSGRIRQILQQGTACSPSMEQMAKLLGVHVRTLRRYLAHEEMNYQQLVQTHRHQLAEELLSTTNKPISVIAIELQYSEASSFTRSFKTFKGMTPKEFRETCQQEAP